MPGVRPILILMLAALPATMPAGEVRVEIRDAKGVPVATPDLVPYVNLYGLLAVIGTAMVLIVQTITSLAVISYFLITCSMSFWSMSWSSARLSPAVRHSRMRG